MQGNRHSLTVLSVEKGHLGVYACHAANAYGADSKKIEVSGEFDDDDIDDDKDDDNDDDDNDDDDNDDDDNVDYDDDNYDNDDD